jgi:hypothetical protein
MPLCSINDYSAQQSCVAEIYLWRCAMNRRKLQTSIRNVGTHGVKQMAPADLERFLKLLFRHIFPSAEATYERADVQGAHLANSEILFKPMCVITGGGIRARVSIPSSSQTRNCDVFFTSEKRPDELFAIIREFCAKNPVTNDNWPVIQEKGCVPNTWDEYWTEERIDLFIQAYLKYAAINVSNMHMVCITAAQCDYMMQTIGCYPKRVDDYVKALGHLETKNVIIFEPLLKNQGGRDSSLIFPGEYLAKKCLAMMGATSTETDPLSSFSATYLWLVRELLRLYALREDSNREAHAAEKVRTAAEAEVTRACLVLERAENNLLTAIEKQERIEKQRKNAVPELDALLQTVKDFGPGFSSFMELTAKPSK